MKYGESVFDILYLLFAIISGCLMMCKAADKTEKYMALATLILGCGDAFHLVPRVLNYFSDADYTAALGIGKLVTSITMTGFYLLMYYIWLGRYQVREERRVTLFIRILVIFRIVFCLFPQNGWLENSNDLTWGVIRNIPFVLLGAVVCRMFFQKRQDDHVFSNIWLYILLSFLCYIPVVVGAGLVPAFGMLMLPKTICYILMIAAFLRAVAGTDDSAQVNM